MVSKKIWKKPIDEFIRNVNAMDEESDIYILGKLFKVLPNVFSPIFSSDTAWFADKFSSLTRGKKVLEIGTGTGVIACFCALRGAISVSATDINPDAAKNARLNATLHGLKLTVYQGDMFDPVDKSQKFDIIFWNHPFYCSEKTEDNLDMVSISVYDPNYESLRRFLKDSKKYLTSCGEIILGSSNVARINLIKRIANEEGYKITLIDKTEVPVFQGKTIKMDLRLYSFQCV